MNWNSKCSRCLVFRRIDLLVHVLQQKRMESTQHRNVVSRGIMFSSPGYVFLGSISRHKKNAEKIQVMSKNIPFLNEYLRFAMKLHRRPATKQ